MRIHWIGAIFLFLLSFPAFLGCDYARMKEQEAIRTYQEKLPEMPRKTVPLVGGVQEIKDMDPGKMKNPLPQDQASLQRGRDGYGYYCVMCHGPKGDGQGTVGQSFSPLPTDLRGSPVQNQNDGRLFFTITFGFRRHPSLGFMVAEEDRWAIIYYIRSLSRPARS